MDLSYREATLSLLDYTPLYLLTDNTFICINKDTEVIVLTPENEVHKVSAFGENVGEYFIDSSTLLVYEEKPIYCVNIECKPEVNLEIMKVYPKVPGLFFDIQVYIKNKPTTSE